MEVNNEMMMEIIAESIKHPIGMINANDNADVDVFLSQDLELRDAVYRADVLRDAIYYLQIKYEKAVEDMGE